MKLLFGQGLREMVTAHRIFGFSFGRKHGWQYGLLLSEDHRTVYIGWFREQAHVHLEDNDNNASD